jgi:hypothetical protein
MLGDTTNFIMRKYIAQIHPQIILFLFFHLNFHITYPEYRTEREK